MRRMKRYRVYTGPTIVKEVADWLSQAYLRVTVVGTEHVYLETNHDVDYLLAVLGPTWTHRDVGRLDA